MENGIKHLSSEEAKKKLDFYGPNILEEEKVSLFIKVLKWLVSPISLMLIAAAALSEFSGKDFDFYTIVFLLFLNFFITYWQEKKADTAIRQLKQRLITTVNVLRDGDWVKLDSRYLVPGDAIKLFIGNVIPADLIIDQADNLMVNESTITGESLPKSKGAGETLYSGSIIVTGRVVATVQSTGSKTYFGKTLSSVERVKKTSILEQDILSISKYLSILSLVCISILTILFLLAKQPLIEIMTLDLSLLIAGIPISLPTVMTLIISFGVLELAKKNAIVRRISSLEDLANVDIVLSDKTGTLTKNKLSVQQIIGYKKTPDEVLTYAYLSAYNDADNPISAAVIDKFEKSGIRLPNDIVFGDMVPADGNNKRSTTAVTVNGNKKVLAFGAPQVVGALCEEGGDLIDKDIVRSASKGWRMLGVALKENEKWILAGSLAIADDLWEDSGEVVSFLREQGVAVKMVTGDNRAIAQYIGEKLGIESENVYYEVFPEDKYKLVLREKEGHHIVASTGDGINDLPALKAANVGVAVQNAVDALKGAADIVLLSPGLAVIKDAIIESRKIFQRLYNYSIYRVSESFRLILSIFALGLIVGAYPLTPVQLIILALLNDIPIISLAFDRVKITNKPSRIQVLRRFIISSSYGLIGVANSVAFFLLAVYVFHISTPIVMTLFFLKLTIGGHMLIYVAHTEEKWWRFLPSKQVIFATTVTQAIATILALMGIFMEKAPWQLVFFVWVWAFFWMQVSELFKLIFTKDGK